MEVVLNDLLSKRLVILSGKSTVGLVVALAATERGKCVLLVEVDTPFEAARLLGAHPVGCRETEIGPVSRR